MNTGAPKKLADTQNVLGLEQEDLNNLLLQHRLTLSGESVVVSRTIEDARMWRDAVVQGTQI